MSRPLGSVVRVAGTAARQWEVVAGVRVIPVIDLCRGTVVRAVGGQRAEYRPVVGCLAESAEPATVAQALVQRFAARDVYVADLDAIAGARPDETSYRSIAACGLRLWIDAGVSRLAQAVELLQLANQGVGLVRLIVSVESWPGPGELAELVRTVGPDGLALSLDLREGCLLPRPGWDGQGPREAACAAADLAVRDVIVLDLARVGRAGGTGTERLCQELVALRPELRVIAGGGVRGREDLVRLAVAGCHAALVASALHDGHLTAADLVDLPP